LKVRTYIWILSSASIGGALLVGIFGWWMFSSTNQLANELHQESKFSGQSAGEYSDVKDFLEVTRGIVVSFEVYPQNYEGIFGVTWDRFTAAKIGLNQISDQYLKNYPQSMLEPIANGLNNLSLSIKTMEKMSVWKEEVNFKGNNSVKKQFNDAREELDQGLNLLEQAAEQFLQNSKFSLDAKQSELNQKEESDLILLSIASTLYFLLVTSLAFVIYKSFASPIRKLESAAKSSIDDNRPFTLKESGPYEIKSLIRRLQGLILGLESTVKKRTSSLQAKTVQLQEEMVQRKELETQLVHAQKMEAVGQLASGIAHEINSPSQFANDNILFLKDAVDGFIAKLRGEATAPDLKELQFLVENAPEAVDQAKEGISRITTIVKSMKNFAYKDAESAKRPSDLNQAIQSTIVVATNEWKYHAELKLELDENLPFVPCNIGEINQVVLNLVVNGAHAIRDRFQEAQKGNLKVTTMHYADAGCVVISINDDGGGIPKKVQTRIFEPFFTTKEVGVGTGQGLAIAHNVIVKSHSGQIWFDTQEGVGTTFFIKLPMDNKGVEDK
jgi:signal transduction histidine kinase